MLKAAVSAALILILTLSTAASAGTNLPAGEATPIEHVVMIMMENHSFDNFFGTYPTMNGSVASPVAREIQRPTNLLDLPHPPPVRAVPNATWFTENPYEGYSNYQGDWDSGAMDGFQINSGPQSMTYFTASQLPVEWDWAEEYSTGDMYFGSYLSTTAPNRLYSLAGYSPVTGDTGPPPEIPVNESIFAELEHYGVSWGYFVPDLEGIPYPLGYFDGISSYSSHLGTVSQFELELNQSSLPAVSWVMPLGGHLDFSQHPSQNVTEGEDWLLGVVDHVMRSTYWKTTAIFITYDEGGGYYDQVPPPILGGIRLGFRVPLIVISPYAKEDYVSNTVMNHASLLSFVDYNWRLPPLNGFVAESGLPLDLFDFAASPRPPLTLANDSRFPLEPQVPFESLPYQRQGSVNTSLASLGEMTYWVTSNASVSPVPAGIQELLAVVAVLAVAGVWLRRRSHRRGRNRPVEAV